jgi:hypothetical protein
VPLSEFELKRIEKIFNDYCLNKIPAKLQSRIKMEYRVREDEVTLFESRPVWDDHAMWISGKVARFSKDPETGGWFLYQAALDGSWSQYEPLPFHRQIEKLLDVVEKNETGAFWG